MILARLLILPLEPFILIILALCSLVARFCPKKFDIGLGPLPLINNIYHKKVFERLGYSSETFVNQVWHVTNSFDARHDLHPLNRIPILGARINTLRVFIWSIFRYRCMIIYFNGGPIGLTKTFLLWRFEPFLLNLANVKTFVLAYGADVQVMSRSPNLVFKDTMSKDYPNHRLLHKHLADMVDLWTSYGSHTVGGCEWVDYMHHWDTLMISHFSIDTEDWTSTKINPQASSPDKPLRVFHAPNHREIKGTRHLIRAVDELRAEGVDIELVLAEKRPNHEIREIIESVDVVVDQLIIGWYAMFAIESMALNKPVICNVRSDLENLYRTVGLYNQEEVIPLIHADPLTIKDVLRNLCKDRQGLFDRGNTGRDYVMRHHSIESISKVFSTIINDLIGRPQEVH